MATKIVRGKKLKAFLIIISLVALLLLILIIKGYSKRLSGPVSAIHSPVTDGSSQLYFDRPAGLFTEAFPVGNGRLGGMVYGGSKRERILLNEISMWSGSYQAVSYTHLDVYKRQGREKCSRLFFLYDPACR